MADQIPDMNTSGSRRLKYGSNLLLLLIIAIVIVGMLAFLTTRYNRQFDWSTGGLFTLAPQTQNLLKTVDEKKQPVEIIDYYNIDATSTHDDIQHAQQVHDLLDQYVRQAGSIKLAEPKGREELEAKIRERYTAETKPYEAVVADFDKLAMSLTKFFQTQANGFDELAHAKGVGADDAREIQGVANAFRKEFPTLIAKAQKNVRKNIDSTMPEWSQAKMQISEVVTIISEQLKQVANIGSSTDGFSKTILDYFKKTAPDYNAMLKDVNAYKDRLDKLPALKVDDVLGSIGPNTLIVIGPTSVKVIPSGDMFKPDTNDNSPRPKLMFQGEQAISTAIMAIVQPDKPKVVFITSAPSQLLTGPFSEINDRLTKANFDVSEWAPPGMPNPEQPQPPSGPPASGKDADGKPIVWVVLPPEPPNMQQMQMGMPPPDPRPIIEMIKKHMEAGGSVLFLAEGASPMSMMGGGGGYPYAELIKPFGIQVKDNYYVLRTMRAGEDASRTVPQIDFSTFPDHEITRPLQSLMTFFVGSPGQMGINGAPTVVDIAKPAPTGSAPAVIVETPASADIFATSNTMTGNPEFDPKNDLKAPIPMGAASTLSVGKNNERIVVLGNKLFLVNQLLQSQAMDIQSGRVFYQFPGNAELMINCVSWLSDSANMIAVSPQANVAQRIASMGETQAILLRVGSFIVPPILAIVLGTAIFFMRRRA